MRAGSQLFYWQRNNDFEVPRGVKRVYYNVWRVVEHALRSGAAYLP
jgi:hypothetical protein